MKRLKAVKLRVRKGPVRVNCAYLERGSPTIKCIYVDLHSKYAGICCTGSGGRAGPMVALEATKHTLHCDPKFSKTRDLTEIGFVGMQGWSVFSAAAGRYTLAVCLVKDRK